MNKFGLLALIASLSSSVVVADDKSKEATSIGEMFSNGTLKSRIRSNTFKWDWDKEVEKKTKSHIISGLGGSVLYDTASLSGFSLGGGLYYSYAFSNIDISDGDDSELGYLKSGKGILSRYDRINGNGKNGMLVPAMYYAKYNIGKTKIKAGQQMYNSLFTKANDATMIPNTFMGATIVNKDITKTKVRLAMFTAQKLRNHTTNHDLITFKTDDDGTTNYKWNNNDDSAANKSLSYNKLKAAGMATEHKMITGDVNTKIINNLNMTFSGNYINEIVAQGAVEAHYKISLGDASIKPGIRHISQKGLTGDKLTDIANLKGKTTGYTSPDSLDGGITAARVDIDSGMGIKFRYGYSKVADKADILSMWRGSPTSGFTGAMAQYNWYANTVTNMVQTNINFGKLGLVKGLKIMARYSMQDFDENKKVQGDTNIVHIDVKQKVSKALDLKFRFGKTVYAEKETNAYSEYRFEANYRF